MEEVKYMKLRKGDTVKVLSGNDKGKTGEVLTVLPKSNKVVVKDVNIRKKATKPKKAGDTGGIIASEHPVNASIVEVVCPKCGKTTRVGYKITDGKKVRVCKKCGAELNK
jgi:large subunit ribosomal protein L24